MKMGQIQAQKQLRGVINPISKQKVPAGHPYFEEKLRCRGIYAPILPPPPKITVRGGAHRQFLLRILGCPIQHARASAMRSWRTSQAPAPARLGVCARPPACAQARPRARAHVCAPARTLAAWYSHEYHAAREQVCEPKAHTPASIHQILSDLMNTTLRAAYRPVSLSEFFPPKGKKIQRERELNSPFGGNLVPQQRWDFTMPLWGH